MGEFALEVRRSTASHSTSRTYSSIIRGRFSRSSEAAILRNPPSDLVPAITLVTCFQRVPVGIPVGTAATLVEISYYFIQVLQANTGMVL
jgi:hypothetical protein